MTSRSLSRRLERLEERTILIGEPTVITVVYVDAITKQPVESFPVEIPSDRRVQACREEPIVRIRSISPEVRAHLRHWY